MSQGEAGHGGEWRVAVRGEQRGPFTLDQVRGMIVEGRLPADTLVWRPGMGNWAALSSVPELVAPVGRGPAPAAAASPTPAASPAATPVASAPTPIAVSDAQVEPSSSPVADFLAFRTMLTPFLVKIIFCVGIAGCVISAVGSLFMGLHGVIVALVTLLVGPVVVRVYCELLILLFRIYDTLQEIKNQRK